MLVCPDCGYEGEFYDGGEANDCQLLICPECNFDLNSDEPDEPECPHLVTDVGKFDDLTPVQYCRDCGEIVAWL